MNCVGIDEVGRGCWAGPLVAGAVLLGQPIRGLADSKVLSAAARTKLAATIQVEAKAYGLGWVAADELDKVGITTAVKMAMQRALQALRMMAGDEYTLDDVVIDGNYNYLPDEPNVRCLIMADATVPAVSAASILAKVARDTYMVDMARTYPGYGFESHVGYGTAAHSNALKALGVCPLHRTSFAPIRACLSEMT